MNVLRAIAAAFSYFSILPARSFAVPPDGATIGWLPLVGLAVGLAAGAAGYAVFILTSAPLWALVVAFAGGIIFSGAIHIDGFLDCADALVMTAPTRRRLDVLHDPRHGTYAVVAMTLLVVVWIAALASIVPRQMPMMLAVAAVAGRAAVVPLGGQYPHARTGLRYERTIAYGALWFVALAIVFVSIDRSWQPLAVLAGAYALAQLLGWAASRRLGGGLTGDVFGAIVVVTEVAVLIAAPLLRAGVS